jgi:competence protein ComEC
MRLPFFLLSYTAGLGCAPFLNFSLLLTAIPLAVAALWFMVRRYRWAGLLLVAFFWTLGVSLYHLQTTPPRDPDHVRSFICEKKLAVEGTVLSVSSRPLQRSVIDLQARRVVSEGIAVSVKGKIRLYTYEGNPQVHPGDDIRFLSPLRAPRSFGTPGEFDFPRHLAYQGIFVTAYVPHAADLVPLGSKRMGKAAFLVERQRTVIGQFIDRAVEPSLAPLVRALVIGDKGGITSEQRNLMARGGVSHLFAISGLHLGLIALFLYTGARFLYCRFEPLLLFGPPRRYLPILLVPLLLIYLLLTGNAIPTLRAFLMTLVGALLFFYARRTPPLKLLAAVAFLILCADPLAFFEVSFQLSFAGVLGILVLMPRWSAGLTATSRPLRWVATLFLATLAATITTTPLALFHFHLLAPAGLFTNLAAVPLIGFVAVPMGLCGAVLSPFWPFAAAMLLQGCGLTIQAVLEIIEWAIGFPALEGLKIYCSPLQISGTFLLTLTLLLPAGTFWWRCSKMLLLVTATALLFLPPSVPAGLTVTALSVGQGDAILLSRQDGRHYLIDGGGLPSKTFDVGERLVAPALGWMGVRSLEAVILTHDHPDHRKGLLHILEHFPVKAFWSSAPLNELHFPLQKVLLKKNIPVVLFPPGWTVLDKTGEEALSVFAPRQEEEALNDRSLVLYARRGKDGVLLTGDLEERGVAQLIAATTFHQVTLLKVPHHGSRKSSPELLLNHLKPELAFVSLGAGNCYGFPHERVVASIRQRKIPFYRTDLCGSLKFLTRGSGWQAQRWEKGVFQRKAG